MRMTARNRLHSLLDEGSLVELGSELEPKDVLKFRDSKKYTKTNERQPQYHCCAGTKTEKQSPGDRVRWHKAEPNSAHCAHQGNERCNTTLIFHMM